MNTKIVTRFAPSPTGFLHGGNYRTAVFAYLFAKKMSGSFIVRIEDTDKERSKKEYEENIVETLQWLGLPYDALYRQSEHHPRHTEELRRLIASGHAYVSEETPTEPGQRAEVIRFKNPNKQVSFTDVIRGEITFDTTELGDFVIAKSESEPVFHLAVVVDDHDEGVTHVIRGEDHISNTPRQILIQEALGYTTPIYAHLPLVLSPDRSKLSKRRGAKALTVYKAEGFLPEAMINYLALLGWHPEGEQEIFTVEELSKAFDLERIQKGSGIFDEIKLTWFNYEHLKKLSALEYETKLKAFLEEYGEKAPQYLIDITPELQMRAQTFGEAAELVRLGEFAFMEDDITVDTLLLLQGAKAEASAVKTNLQKVGKLLQNLRDEDFTAEKIKEVIFPYATEVGRAAVLWPMRVALSGKEKSPDPFVLAGLIGKERTRLRIEKAAAML
jgi:glutamyl-tRNA synthetase